MTNETFHWTVLDNVMQIKVKQVFHQRTINLGLFIRHGAQEENLSNSGISHYIEHAVFNPVHMTGHTKELIESLMDAGVSYEAFTSKEYTRCAITCLPSLLPQAVEFLGRLVCDRKTAGVTSSTIEHERTVILH